MRTRKTLTRPVRIPVLLGLMLLLPLLGGCEYFEDVVVPIHDNTPPAAWAFVLENGNYLLANGATWETRDPSKAFVIMATAYDHGGARRVTLRGTAVGEYRAPLQGWCEYEYEYFPLVEEVPDACPGDVVSNGLWVADYVTPGSIFPLNCGGRKLVTAVYTWTVEAEDMHGNVTTSPVATLRYRR